MANKIVKPIHVFEVSTPSIILKENNFSLRKPDWCKSLLVTSFIACSTHESPFFIWYIEQIFTRHKWIEDMALKSIPLNLNIHTFRFSFQSKFYAAHIGPIWFEISSSLIFHLPTKFLHFKGNTGHFLKFASL